MIDFTLAGQLGNLLDLQGQVRPVWLLVRNTQAGSPNGTVDKFVSYFIPRARKYETKQVRQGADGSSLVQTTSKFDIDLQNLQMSGAPRPQEQNYIQDMNGVGWLIVDVTSEFAEAEFSCEVQKFTGWKPVEVTTP
jgi:hypothetical protein